MIGLKFVTGVFVQTFLRDKPQGTSRILKRLLHSMLSELVRECRKIEVKINKGKLRALYRGGMGKPCNRNYN